MPDIARLVDEFEFQSGEDAWLDRARAIEERPGSRSFLHYELLTRTRQAGGAIHRAWDRRQRRFVALEFVRPGGCEIEPLEHAGIARYFGSASAGAYTAVLSEWVDGVAIDRWWQQRGPGRGASELRVVAVKICDALEHAHRAGVVHGSLESTSIRIVEGNEPRLTGLHGRARDEPLGDTARPYAAPERLAGCAATAAGDVYACARILEPLFASLGAGATKVLAPALAEDPRVRLASCAALGERFARRGLLASVRDWFDCRKRFS